MRLYLDDRGLYSCRLNDEFQLRQCDVGKPDCSALPAINETFQGAPGVDQAHLVVINDVAMFVSRIVIFARLKGEWCMDEVAIDIIDLKAPATCVKRWFDPLGPMIGVP